MSETTYDLLQTALRHNNPKTFFTILEAQPLPHDSSWQDYNLLVDAIKLGRKSMALQLLDKGCRVVKPRSRAESPLHLAVMRAGGWSNVVEKLLRRGAKVADVDEDGNTALHLAFLNGALDYTIDLLMEKFVGESCENASNRDGLSALHIACTRRNRRVVRLLLMGDNLNCQVLPNSTSIYAGCTPLHFAVCYARHDIAELLLENNADVYARNANNSTPLHLALYRRDVDMMDLILSYDKLRLECVDNTGLTHFMAACAANNTIVAEEFLFKNASPQTLLNARVNDFTESPYAGYSPLHFAAEFERFLTAVMLANYGARYVAAGKQSVTPMMLAVRNEDATTCHVLRESYGYECQ